MSRNFHMTKMQYFQEIEDGLSRCGYQWLQSCRREVLRMKKKDVADLANIFRYGGIDELRQYCSNVGLLFRDKWEHTITARLSMACNVPVWGR